MKQLIVILLAISSNACWAQILGQQAGYRVGTFFTESFGDAGTQPCGYGPPWNLGLYQFQGCNVIWGSVQIGTGGSISIVASPGNKGLPQGLHSLKVVTGTSPTTIATAGYTPTVSASTPVDLQFTLNISATSLSAYNGQPIYTLLTTPDSGSFPCRVDLHSTSAGTIAVRGEGSNTSGDSSNLPLNTDHVVFMHCAPGLAGASYVTLDGGAKLTFTANALPWTSQIIGAWDGSQQSVTYTIGSVTVNAAVQSAGNGPLLYTNFEGGSPGTAISNNLLTQSTVGGNGEWDTCSTGNGFTFSPSAQLSLLSPITVLGTQFTDQAASLGAAFALSGAISGYCPYAWRSYSPTASTFEWVEITLPTSDTSTYASMDIQTNESGSDFVSHMFNSGKLYIETNANPNGAPDAGSVFFYAPSTKYGIATQFQEYSAGSVPGAVYLVQGTVSSGTFTANEVLTQTHTRAVANLIGDMSNSLALQVQMVSGNADAKETWVGQTSGAVFTPSSLPTTFHTMIVYDANCNVLSRQLKVAVPASPSIPASFYLGRGGDQNGSTVNASFYADNLIIDYATGRMISCY